MEFQFFSSNRCKFEQNKRLPIAGGGDGIAGIGNFAAETDNFSEKKDKLGGNSGKRGMSVGDACITPAVTMVQMGEIDFGILLCSQSQRNQTR